MQQNNVKQFVTVLGKVLCLPPRREYEMYYGALEQEAESTHPRSSVAQSKCHHLSSAVQFKLNMCCATKSWACFPVCVCLSC